MPRARARRALLGQSTSGAQCNHVPLCLGPLKAQVLAQVAKAPKQTLAQLCQWVKATHGIVLKPSTLNKSLARFGLTFKKTIYASEQQRADIAQVRTRWHDEQVLLATQRLIFFEETSATTNMTPTRGRSLRGQRCPGFTLGGHWRMTTLVCALDAQHVPAPLVLDGPVNDAAFVTWVEQFLALELRPGDIAVMDNLNSHKVVGVKPAIESAGAELRYLQPYSPDYNPIKQVFTKLKTLLRASQARTVEAL